MKKLIIAILCIVLVIVLYKQVRTSTTQDPQALPVLPTTVAEGTTVSEPTQTTPELLQSKTWVWQKTVVIGETTITPNKPGIFTLTFQKDGKVIGKTDCNGFGGEYTLGVSGVLRFEPFMSTLMYCEGSQESAYNIVLGQTTRYAIDSTGVLSLSGSAGTVYFK